VAAIRFVIVNSHDPVDIGVDQPQGETEMVQAGGNACLLVGLSKQRHIFGYELPIDPGLGWAVQQLVVMIRYEAKVLREAHTQRLPR